MTDTFLQVLGGAKNIIVFSHHNPDGDALGSSAGLALSLCRCGVRAAAHVAGSFSEHLGFLLEGVDIDKELARPEQYDLAVLLDCRSFDRLGPEGPAVAAVMAKIPLVVIDHHLLGEGERIEDTWLVRPEAGSTGEMVWDVLKRLDCAPPPAAVRALLVAMATDTGFFTQSNTTPAALRAAAELVELGGELEEVRRLVNGARPLRALKLKGAALKTLTLHLDGRLAVMHITPEMLLETGATMADTENFVELGREVAGVRMSALVKDSGRGTGTVRVSLRSHKGVDAQGLAQLFGGGGHRQAAAYNDPGAGDAAGAMENLIARAHAFL